MKNLEKLKYILIGVIITLFLGTITYASTTQMGTIGSLFEYIGNRYYLNGNNITDSSINSTKIIDESILSSDIFNGTIKQVDLADDSVGTNQLNENEGYSVKGLVSTNGLGVTGSTSLNGILNVNGNINLTNKKVTGVITPTLGSDAVNKDYVDFKINEIYNYINQNVPCGVDLYKSDSNCILVGIGYYSPKLNDGYFSCTNKPTNSYYTSRGNGTNNCSWTCNSGYTQSGSSCVVLKNRHDNLNYAAACRIDYTGLRKLKSNCTYDSSYSSFRNSYCRSRGPDFKCYY